MLARAFAAEAEPSRALPLFEATRRPRVEPYQQAALDSLRWFEEVADHLSVEGLLVNCVIALPPCHQVE